eukprot:2472744-Rhodomonas_salina.1
MSAWMVQFLLGLPVLLRSVISHPRPPSSSSSSSASCRQQGPRSPTIQLSCAQASLVLPQERSPGGDVQGFYETAP